MINIIPKPLKVNVTDGKETVNSASTVYCDAELLKAKNMLNLLLKTNAGYELKDGIRSEAAIIILTDKDLPGEAYSIVINKGIIIKASTYVGALYAVSSLRQLKDADSDGNLNFANMEIYDEPRFKWRSVMLDVSRHFSGKEEIFRLLDLMLLHKLNVFHWHLTDDNGWRVEIKKYPLLTEIGSKRKDTQINGWNRTDMRGEPHEGFYSREDIQEIVEYAKDRGIEIVPEIDMPAHFAAALAAYNWLGCREINSEVQSFFGGKVPESQGIKDWNRIACAGKESTYRFIFDVIDELAELFPSRYFHIGGDEAPKNEWKKCPECRAKMKKYNLSNEEELQGYFNNRIYEYLKAKGKILVGWNEILAAKNLDSDVVVQYWTLKRDSNVENHAKKGGKVILSKHQCFYFDMCYSMIPLDKTYNFEPSQYNIEGEENGNIFGVEGCLWTEWIADREKSDVSLFPRMAALAEVAWTDKKGKDLDDFLSRLEALKKIYDKSGVWYAENEVSMPKGYFRKKRDIKNWYSCDQMFDVRYNKEARAKLGKT